MHHVSIRMSDPAYEAAANRAKELRYPSVSEYFRDLARKDIEEPSALQKMEEAMVAGLNRQNGKLLSIGSAVQGIFSMMSKFIELQIAKEGMTVEAFMSMVAKDTGHKVNGTH
jgi:Arc/MetJ-type ribon-helix-helix transcriptional regulator